MSEQPQPDPRFSLLLFAMGFFAVWVMGRWMMAPLPITERSAGGAGFTVLGIVVAVGLGRVLRDATRNVFAGAVACAAVLLLFAWIAERGAPGLRTRVAAQRAPALALSPDELRRQAEELDRLTRILQSASQGS